MKSAADYSDPGERAPAFLFRRISWGAVFAGLFVTMVFQVMFMLLGAAIGSTVFTPAQEHNSPQGLATGSAVWILVTGLISLFIGSSVAGRLSGGPRRADGMLHGLVTWSVSTLAVMILAATAAGTLLAGLGSLLSGALEHRTARQETSISSIGQGVESLFSNPGALAPTGREQNPGAPGTLTDMAGQDPQLGAAVAKMEARGGASSAPAERNQVKDILMSKHHMTDAQAEGAIQQWDQEIRKKTRQATTAAASTVSQGAWWGFVSLILGLLVAAWGGWAGASSIPARVEAPPAPA